MKKDDEDGGMGGRDAWQLSIREEHANMGYVFTSHRSHYSY